MPLSRRPKHRHRRSGIRRVCTAQVSEVVGQGGTLRWPIREDSFWDSEGRYAIRGNTHHVLRGVDRTNVAHYDNGKVFRIEQR